MAGSLMPFAIIFLEKLDVCGMPYVRQRLFNALTTNEPILRDVLRDELDGFDDIALIGEPADDESTLQDILDLCAELGLHGRVGACVKQS